MKNVKKLLIILIGVIIVVGGTLCWENYQQNVLMASDVANKTPKDDHGLSPNEHIQLIFPKGGEALEIGKTYTIQWTTQHPGSEPVSIYLLSNIKDQIFSSKKIASGIPNTAAGTYKWTVSAENTEGRYKIEVYPPGGRELVGRSTNFFTIVVPRK